MRKLAFANDMQIKLAVANEICTCKFAYCIKSRKIKEGIVNMVPDGHSPCKIYWYETIENINVL